MTVPFTTQSLQDALTAKLALNFGTEPGEATDQEMLKACALVLRKRKRSRKSRSTISLWNFSWAGA